MKAFSFFKIILHTLFLFSLSSHAYLLFINGHYGMYTAPDSITEWSEHPLSKQCPNIRFIEATYGTPDTNYPGTLFILGYDYGKGAPIVFYSTDGLSFKSSLVPVTINDRDDIEGIATPLYFERFMHIGINRDSITVYGTISTGKFSVTGSISHDQNQYHIDEWQDNTSVIDNMVDPDNAQCTLLKTGMIGSQNYRYVLVEYPSYPLQKRQYLNVYTSNFSNFYNPKCLMSVNLDRRNISDFNMQADLNGAITLFELGKYVAKSNPDLRFGLLSYTPASDAPCAKETVPLPLNVSSCARYYIHHHTILLSRKQQVFFLQTDPACLGRTTKTYSIATTKIGATLDTLKIVHTINVPVGSQVSGQFLYVNGKYLFILTSYNPHKSTQPIILQSKDAYSWEDISANVTLPPDNIVAKTTFYIPDHH